MEKQKETSTPCVPHKLNEAETERMKAWLEVVGDRVEVLEWLDNHVYFFPDWQKTVNEALLLQMDKKQALNIACDEEKEILIDMNFFFSKMAYFNELISTWHKELSGEKELTEQQVNG
jgi:hypothetical protein